MNAKNHFRNPFIICSIYVPFSTPPFHIGGIVYSLAVSAAGTASAVSSAEAASSAGASSAGASSAGVSLAGSSFTGSGSAGFSEVSSFFCCSQESELSDGKLRKCFYIVRTFALRKPSGEKDRSSCREVENL
jgi:hypothetical protein